MIRVVPAQETHIKRTAGDAVQVYERATLSRAFAFLPPPTPTPSVLIFSQLQRYLMARTVSGGLALWLRRWPQLSAARSVAEDLISLTLPS